jgi:hypothetical protein
MSNRKLPIDKEESKRVRGMLSQCKNSVERLRVMIVATYLWGKNTAETYASLWTFQSTVVKVIQQYVEDKDWFYKTKYKWKKTSEKNQKLKEDIKRYIEKWIEASNPIDINDVRKAMNKKYGEDVINYVQCRSIIRQHFKYNYQKPYVTSRKQPEHAKDIAEWRLRKAIFRIGIEEKKIDAQAIKNKKTKFWGVTW